MTSLSYIDSLESWYPNMLTLLRLLRCFVILEFPALTGDG